MLFRQSTAPRQLQPGARQQVSATLVILHQQHMQSSEHKGSSTKHPCRWVTGTSTPPHSSEGTQADTGICHPVQTTEHSNNPRPAAQPTLCRCNCAFPQPTKGHLHLPGLALLQQKLICCCARCPQPPGSSSCKCS